MKKCEVEEKSAAHPALREVDGNSVSPKAVIAPLTARIRVAAKAKTSSFRVGPVPVCCIGGRPDPHHAVSAIAASIKSVFTRCAER